MKSQIFLALILSILSAPLLAQSAAGPLTDSGNRELLQDIKSEVERCVVKSQTARSECETVLLGFGPKAMVFVDGQWFTAKIFQSANSDGGDLDNLLIYDSSGNLVAQRINVAAFDDIVIAMEGGNSAP